MQNLTVEQLTDLLEKAHRVIEAAQALIGDMDESLGIRLADDYDSALLAYDAARDVLRDAQRKQVNRA